MASVEISYFRTAWAEPTMSIAMPLQCSMQWDGLGNIFDLGLAWSEHRAGDVVTSGRDLVTGSKNATSAVVARGVLSISAAELEA